jgi:hypothetical protein
MRTSAVWDITRDGAVCLKQVTGAVMPQTVGHTIGQFARDECITSFIPMGIIVQHQRELTRRLERGQQIDDLERRGRPAFFEKAKILVLIWLVPGVPEALPVARAFLRVPVMETRRYMRFSAASLKPYRSR